MKFLFFFLFVFFVSPFSLYANELTLDTTLLSQFREDETGRNEIPLSGYFGLTGNHSKWKLVGESDMRVFRDFEQSLDDYDLYQAVLHFKPVEKVTIDFGRQFLSQGFSASVIDGVRTTIQPISSLDVILYSGINRSVERGDFNDDDGILSGFSVESHGWERTGAQLHVAWRRNRLRVNNLKENDSVLVGLNLSREMDVPARPLFYGIFEMDTTAKVVETGTAGVDLYPSKKTGINLEFNYYDVNRDTNQNTIMGLFSQGRIINSRLAGSYTLIPNRIDFEGGYSYQRMEIQSAVYRRGHLVDAGFPISFEDLGLFLHPVYYFSRSFGGTLHGGRVSAHKKMGQKGYVDAGFDYASYKKITNDNDKASSTFVWAGYEVMSGLKASLGFEYNKNNLFNQDVRGSLKLDYQYGS